MEVFNINYSIMSHSRHVSSEHWIWDGCIEIIERWCGSSTYVVDSCGQCICLCTSTCIRWWDLCTFRRWGTDLIGIHSPLHNHKTLSLYSLWSSDAVTALCNTHTIRNVFDLRNATDTVLVWHQPSCCLCAQFALCLNGQTDICLSVFRQTDIKQDVCLSVCRTPVFCRNG